MPVKKRAAKLEQAGSRGEIDVIEFLDRLNHPRRMEIDAIRNIILGVSPAISEGIKWKSPSFRTTEDFATLNLRGERLWLILHTGAKSKTNTAETKPIPNSLGLLEWLGKDRGVVKFENARDVASKRKSLERLVRKWIKQL